MALEHLFSPYHIKTISLKNRIVLPPLASFLFGKHGSVTADSIEHYRRRASGGPAMVIMEACAVSAEGVVSPNQPRIDSDQSIEGLRRIANAIKAEGAVAGIQIHHAGRQTSAKVIKRLPLAPSPLPCPSIRGDVEPLSKDRIRHLVDQFAAAAIRCRESGFELLEIHGAHGYLINQFLSPYSNIRQDEYGGDVTGRTRFARQIVTEIRNQVGADFPISFKISAQEFVPGGLTIPQSILILVHLIEAGIDIVQVSAGNDATPEWICQPMFMEKACLADSAAQIRRQLHIPTMAVGRINDPFTAEAIIKTGQADLVCIGRGLMADPEMPKKAQANRINDIRICIACNTCMQSIFRKGRLECLVNPSLGREKEMEIEPTATPKKIMVVGGGPGGLNTAWVAARRGHEVHLFEKQSHLGGQLVPGSKTSYKTEMQSLVHFLIKQVDRHGVTCHLNQHVDVETVKRMNPDVVILATGAKPSLPMVEGIDGPKVVTFNAVLNGRPERQRHTVVIGGGATGCEVAYHLAESGTPVTVVEMQNRIGGDLEAITKRLLIRKLTDKKVSLLTEHRLVKIEPDRVILSGPDQKEKTIATEQIVIAVGIQPNDAIHESIKALGYETHVIGDCLQPRTAKTAIYEGAVLGRRL